MAERSIVPLALLGVRAGSGAPHGTMPSPAYLLARPRSGRKHVGVHAPAMFSTTILRGHHIPSIAVGDEGHTPLVKGAAEGRRPGV